MVASCWLFLYDLYYDAQNHEHKDFPIMLRLCIKNSDRECWVWQSI